MPTTSIAGVSTAEPRLSFPSSPRSWRSAPAFLSPPVVGFSFSNSAPDGRRLPRLMADAVTPRYEKPASRLRGRCSTSEDPTGATMSAIELLPSLELKAKGSEVVDALKGTSLFLVGMNSGMKTKVGKVLADALTYCYFDSDDVVEEVVGGAGPARDFREHNEKAFLESETEVLRQLTSMARLVVCAGDGATCGATNLSYLRYGISIWIDIPLDVIADEKLDEGAFDEIVVDLARRYGKMKGGYATADAVISLQKVASKLGYENPGDVTPEDMALEVLREIEKLTRLKKMMEDAARPF